MTGIVLKTPAKINLGLQVGKKRSDGYHEVRTLYQTIDIYDRLKVSYSSGSGDILQVTGGRYADSIPRDSSNILLKTLTQLRHEGLDVPPLKIELEKNIPVEAGLGGGSSDAAALLRSFKLLAETVALPSSQLLRIASTIGSDVPFFLRGGTMLGKGRGDVLKPITDIRAKMILVSPPYSSDTEEAYNSLESKRETFENFNVTISDSTKQQSISDMGLGLRNDFAEVLKKKRKLHRKIREKLEDWSDYVGVSGSGSSLYALFNPESSLEPIKQNLADELTSCEIYSGQFISSNQMPQMGRMQSCQLR